MKRYSVSRNTPTAVKQAFHDNLLLLEPEVSFFFLFGSYRYLFPCLSELLMIESSVSGLIAGHPFSRLQRSIMCRAILCYLSVGLNIVPDCLISKHIDQQNFECSLFLGNNREPRAGGLENCLFKKRLS